MAQVTDSDGTQYPAILNKVTTSDVLVTMAGVIGYEKVTNGDNRTGKVTDDKGNAYDVKLPGLRTGPPLVVTFTRAMAGAANAKSE